MNTIIKLLAVAAAVLGPTGHTRAAVDFGAPIGNTYTAAWTGTQAIADNNGSGVSFGLNFDDAFAERITSLSVSFTISGGYNGDLYAYLSHGDGLVVLLNRIGRTASDPDGSDTSGFSTFVLNSAAVTDVHAATGTAGSPLTGTFAPDGRNILPSSSGVAFDAASRDATFSTLTMDNPNGSWTLFFADVSPGFSGTLTEWSVSVEAVPEPVTLSLGGFALLFGGVQFWRWRQQRK
jgi:hypothetical protein